MSGRARWTTRLAGPATALLVALACTTGNAYGAQRGSDKPPPNAPESCPYCAGDPELMARGGIVSHGGFEFASHDTAATDAYLAVADIRWIESEHFEIGLAVGGMKVGQKDKQKVLGELARLSEVFDEVNPKTKSLDPWLRAHLYAQRCEDLYDRFLELVQVSEDAFPDGTKPWDMTGEYMGEGPYLGQKGKYEILVLPSESLHVDFMTHEFGLRHKRSQRWNTIDRDSLILVAHTEQGSLRKDPALHGHVAFGVAHMLLDGYRHYSYDTPVWLHEGFAHFVEREIDPRFNTFDSSEGAAGEKTTKDDWQAEVRKLLQRDEAPRLAVLVNLRSYGELELEHHFTTWSMVEYLVTEHPDAFAGILADLCGRTNDQGIGDGSNMGDAQRDAFRDRLGMTYSEFDRAWGEWVLAGRRSAADN